MTEQKSNAVEIVKKYSNGSIDDNFNSKKKRGSRKTTKVLDKKNNTTLPSSEVEVEKERMDYRVKRKSIDNDESVEERKRALQFRKLKEILMQNVGKGTNISFYRYTKDLIKRYLANPYNYQNEVREVSRYLYRVSTLYKKIILYYATLPTYNYQITQKSSILADVDYEKSMREYQKAIKRLNAINIKKQFANMMLMLIRDGVFYGFVYNYKEDGGFILPLEPRYCKIVGKNEADQWVVAYDMSFFGIGNNVIFVDPDAGFPDQLWDPIFQDGWKSYQEDRQNNRWVQLPTNRTICALANDDTEFNYPQPLFEGVFSPLLDIMDYEQLASDRAILENYVLLVSKIPLIDDSDRVDDFAVSLELVQEMQALIDAAVPDLVGTAYSPMDIQEVTFSRSNNNVNDVNLVQDSINNVFNQAGVSQPVVSGGANNTLGLKYSILNDTAVTFNILTRLEDNFSYWVKRNITEHVTFKFHRQTWYNKDEYIQQKKDAATLGGSALDYLTSLDMTPYEAWFQLIFENRSGIKDIMIPLRSSWSTSWSSNGDIDANTTKRSGGTYNPNNISDPTDQGGRPLEDEISEKGEEARNEGRVEGI